MAYESTRKSPRDKSPGPAMYEVNMNGGGLNQMVGGFDFTFYARKKGSNKFNETRNNFILWFYLFACKSYPPAKS